MAFLDTRLVLLQKLSFLLSPEWIHGLQLLALLHMFHIFRLKVAAWEIVSLRATGGDIWKVFLPFCALCLALLPVHSIKL